MQGDCLSLIFAKYHSGLKHLRSRTVPEENLQKDLQRAREQRDQTKAVSCKPVSPALTLSVIQEETMELNTKGSSIISQRLSGRVA